MATAKEIKKNNLDAELIVLSEEIQSRNKELNTLVNSIDKYKSIEAELIELKKETDKYVKDAYSKVKEDDANLVKKHADFDTKKAELGPELKSLQGDISKASKELARINNSCIIAKEELDNLSSLRIKAQADLKELTDIVLQAEQAKLDLAALIEHKKKVENEINSKVEESNSYLAQVVQNLATLKAETQELILQKDRASYELKAYTDQLYTSMNDYAVVKARLEAKWQQTFPELALPL